MSGAFYRETVHVLRPTERQTRGGSSSLDYAGIRDEAGVERRNCRVRPLSSDEVADQDRTTSVSQWRIASRPGDGDWDVLSTDWLRLPDGTVVEVVGVPARAQHPTRSEVHHVEVLAQEAKN